MTREAVKKCKFQSSLIRVYWNTQPPHFLKNGLGTSPVVQRLGFCASTAGAEGLIPGRGTWVLHGMAKKKKFFFNGLQLL